MRVKYIGKYSDPLELINGKEYVCLGKERTRLRVIDETGDDYLYPENEFIIVGEKEQDEQQ